VPAFLTLRPAPYPGRVNRLALAVLCSLTVAGCSGGGSHAASSTPTATSDPETIHVQVPTDHGGFTGADAKAYDAAYTKCYVDTVKALQANTGDNLLFTELVPGNGRPPSNQGCHDGIRAGMP
jgi:hypothetical protein